jgi:hypothetical protein
MKLLMIIASDDGETIYNVMGEMDKFEGDFYV